MSAMRDLLEEIAKALVDNPEDVSVTEVEGEQTTVLELREQGLLEAAALPPYGEVPGAATGNGNQLTPALDELSRKVELEQALRASHGRPRHEERQSMRMRRSRSKGFLKHAAQSVLMPWGGAVSPEP